MQIQSVSALMPKTINRNSNQQISFGNHAGDRWFDKPLEQVGREASEYKQLANALYAKCQELIKQKFDNLPVEEKIKTIVDFLGIPAEKVKEMRATHETQLELKAKEAEQQAALKKEQEEAEKTRQEEQRLFDEKVQTLMKTLGILEEEAIATIKKYT